MTWYDAYTRWEASSKDAVAAAAIIDFCEENDISLLTSDEPDPSLITAMLAARYQYSLYGVICITTATVIIPAQTVNIIELES